MLPLPSWLFCKPNFVILANNHISGGYQLTSNVNRYTTDTYEPLICYYHQTGAKDIYFLAKKTEIELQDI